MGSPEEPVNHLKGKGRSRTYWWSVGLIALSIGMTGEGMAQRPDPEAYQRTLSQLTHRDADVRIEGIQRLGRWREVKSLPALLAALRDIEERVCMAATEVVAQFSDPRVLPALLETFARRDRQISQTTAHILSQQSDPSVQAALQEALSGSDIWLRIGAAQALGYRQEPGAVPVLVAEARHPDVEVRLAAIWALLNLSAPPLQPVLLEALRDAHPSVRRLAVRTLTQLTPTPQAIAAFAILLTRDPEVEVRQDAAWALGRVGTSHAITALLMGLIEVDAGSGLAVIDAIKATHDRTVAQALAKAMKTTIAEEAEFLERLGEPVHILPDFLKQQTADTEKQVWAFYEDLKSRQADPALRRTVLTVLAETRDPAEILATAGEGERHPAFIRAAVIVSGHPDPREALFRITLAFTSRDPEERSGAFLALCYVEDPRVWPVLNALAVGNDPVVKASAADALQYFQSHAVIVRVAHAALKWLASDQSEKRVDAVAMLSQPGYTHPYFAKVLRRAAKDPDPKVAAAAKAALASLESADARPAPAPAKREAGPSRRGRKGKATGK